MMSEKQREQLATIVELAMRTIQVADDELEEEGRQDLDVVRSMVQRCKDHCNKILTLLPAQDS